MIANHLAELTGRAVDTVDRLVRRGIKNAIFAEQQTGIAAQLSQLGFVGLPINLPYQLAGAQVPAFDASTVDPVEEVELMAIGAEQEGLAGRRLVGGNDGVSRAARDEAMDQGAGGDIYDLDLPSRPSSSPDVAELE